MTLSNQTAQQALHSQVFWQTLMIYTLCVIIPLNSPDENMIPVNAMQCLLLQEFWLIF